MNICKRFIFSGLTSLLRLLSVSWIIATSSSNKWISIFDVSQTEGEPIPSLGVDELSGDVEEYQSFFEVLCEISPVPIIFKHIFAGAKGYYSHTDNNIVINEGMSEIQTVKTAIHEISHAKLHAKKPKNTEGAEVEHGEEESKKRSVREVEAESIAYTVCQHYNLDTSDYSFGYVASWSSGKELAELKSSLELIRETAAEFITSINEKLTSQQQPYAEAI